ncbi:uncharacterized protein N7473_009082 [Penicillium subrubescens]|nr:uncharacterized protein N7473_009082 [Penicillium subrubescens]KAJ5886408.1 hypothetical protein N7473_009082 [Penicillium subrubescens]
MHPLKEEFISTSTQQTYNIYTIGRHPARTSWQSAPQPTNNPSSSARTNPTNLQVGLATQVSAGQWGWHRQEGISED